MKTQTQNILFLIAIISLIMGLAILIVSDSKTKITTGDAINTCRQLGGQYSLFDYSIEDDGSDYRFTCKIPEKRLFQYSIDNK